MSISDKTAYHCMVQTTDALPETVCQDLNINDLFDELDYTASSVGRQYLYHFLCTDRVSEVARYEELIKTLGADEALRNRLVQKLKKLSSPDAYSIVELLAEEEHHYSRNYLLLLQVCRWLPLLFALLMPFAPTPAIPFLLLIAAYIFNGVLHFKKKNELPNYYFSIPQLRKLLLVTEELANEPCFTTVNKEVKSLSARLGGLKKKLAMFRFGIGLESESAMPIYLITELLNIFFLFDTINIVQSFIAIRDKKNIAVR